MPHWVRPAQSGDAVDAKADKYAAQDQEYKIVPDGVQKRVAQFHRDGSKGE
ncbi:hypothetical protein CFBP6600_44800 (plasmid) [Xanthomonas arboricola pv. corylina]|nr:hypothetical protein CFBP6600_44800 [Xanthomonas arboricola pv. corylina]CAE6868579.1 hypothetical protein CFBP6600_44800 [Xanthomonas arboricola pv. corylina]